MTVFANQIATAKRLIAAKGQTVTFSRPGELNYDPATDTQIGASDTVFTGTAVVLPISGGGSEFDVRLPGVVEGRANHRELLVAAEGMTHAPMAGDKALGIEGDDWTIIGWVPLAPDGTPIIHTVTIKR